MPDLIFHIGLPKCASTTLQRRIFREVPGYLGVGVDLAAPENFAASFQALAPVGARLRGNLSAARAWADRVVDYGKAELPGVSRYIVSSEMLSNRSRFQPRPIIPFLRNFFEQVWTDGNVKVLIVLRNPAERMASSYAQAAGSTFGASQQDFERYVERELTGSRPPMDVGAWVDELYSELGRNNVCVLLMEDIGTLRFWAELKEFTQLDEFVPESMLNADGLNTRSAQPGFWRLSPFDASTRANAQAVVLLQAFWPAGRFNGLRRRVHIGLRRSITVMHSLNPKRRLEKQRGTEIELTDRMRERIRRHYQASHQRLSELLERDLSQLGY